MFLILNKLVLFLFVLIVSGCTSKDKYIDIYEFNKKLENLEKRVDKTEKKVDQFSVLAKALVNNDRVEKIQDKETLALIGVYSDENINIIKGQKLKRYLFIDNLDKKTDSFEKVFFKLKEDSIVFNKSGKEVVLLKKGTIIQSSYRVSKYFLIDRYIIDKKSFVPNIDIFVSEENFTK